jgi:hypothetical protein
VENLTPTGIQSPDRPARSQSLNRLSYRPPSSSSSWFPTFWGQHIGPIFKGHTVQADCLTLENGTYRFSRNVGTTNSRCVKSNNKEDVIYTRHVKHAAPCKHTCGPHKGYFNGQNCSFYNLNWINVRRSQKNGMLFFIQNVCMHIVCF